MVTLREITRENYIECIKLKVAPGQEKFVASNVFSLAQSKYCPECEPLAIYDDETMVGFMMHCVDIKEDTHWIWRLMIGEQHQKKGYGRAAMNLLLNKIKQDKTRDKIFISFEPENSTAEKLYQSLGFVRTGEIRWNEAVMRLDY